MRSLRRTSDLMKNDKSKILTTLLLVIQSCSYAVAAGTADEAAIRNAYSLYVQKKFVPAADAFEVLVRTSTPSSRLYYYAAAANKAAGRIQRAQQLCQYITTNFSSSQEAVHAQQLFQSAPTAVASASPVNGLPSHLKGKSIDELMETEEGRMALKTAMASVPASGARTSGVSKTTTSVSKTPRPRDAAFTAEIIAAEGANGIIPFIKRPDAGLECSMAAMALLPRGREILADMIRCPSSQDIYIVRFPNSSTDYQITPEKIESYHMKDKALWATLIHAAARENPAYNLEQGLSMMTGHAAEKIFANSISEPALALFIGDAIRNQHPIVCLSTDKVPKPELVEEFAGYTITGFDSASGMVTLRNPHAGNSRRFRLEEDPHRKKFDQMNDGYFKMHISLFPKYFKEVARSPI